MRSTTVQRAHLGIKNRRLDPSFHLGRIGIRELIEHEDARYVPLGDLLSEMHEGARLSVSDDGIPMLRLSDLRVCEVEWQGLGHVVPQATNSWPKVRQGDVLFTRAAKPFRSAVVPPGAPSPLTVSPEITVLRPRPAVVSEYLAAVLSTKAFASILQDLAYRGSPSALRRLRLSDIARLPIPLPRRSVQEEIRKGYVKANDLTSQAGKELSQTIRAVHSEIDARLGPPSLPVDRFVIQRSKLEQRWDLPYAKSRLLRSALITNKVMRPLLHLARPVPSSLKGVDEEELVLAVQADHINERTFLVEDAVPRRLADLSPRMRQPLSVGDVLVCTTGSGQQVAYLDEALGESGLPILGSATFTALRFNETPRYFAVALAHRLVWIQLELLASGTVQRFVNKRDLDDLLVPCLSGVWREDFDERMERALQRRREALAERGQLLAVAESFINER